MRDEHSLLFSGIVFENLNFGLDSAMTANIPLCFYREL